MISPSLCPLWINFLKKWGSYPSHLCYDSLRLIISYCSNEDFEIVRAASTLLQTFITSKHIFTERETLIKKHILSEGVFWTIATALKSTTQLTVLQSMSNKQLEQHITSVDTLASIINTLLKHNPRYVVRLISEDIPSSLFGSLNSFLRIYASGKPMKEDLINLRIMHIAPKNTSLNIFILLGTILELVRR